MKPNRLRFARFLLLLLLLGVSSTVYAQKHTDNKSLLWRISGQQMNKPSYLFGTIHLICDEDYIWTDKMKSSLDSADEVCLEMDMDDPTVMMQIASGMIDKSGKTLKDYFADTTYKKLVAFLQDSMGLTINMFQMVKPAALQSIFALRSVSCATPVSYEDNITKAAQQQHKLVKGLETPDEQLALLDKEPIDSVIKGLSESLNNSMDDKIAYQKLVAAYKLQDLPNLYELIQKSKEAGDDIGAFLDERNKKWIERMVDMMDQKGVFFAVGAGHLWGDNGVINLLRKEGFTVESVK